MICIISYLQEYDPQKNTDKKDISNNMFYLQRLKEKLSDVQGSGPEDLHSLSLPNPHSSGFPNHQQGHEDLPSSVRYAAEDSSHDDMSANTHFSNSSKILSNYNDTSHIRLSEYENNNSDNVILHSDTIILVSSMVCMIIMGKTQHIFNFDEFF